MKEREALYVSGLKVRREQKEKKMEGGSNRRMEDHKTQRRVEDGREEDYTPLVEREGKE